MRKDGNEKRGMFLLTDAIHNKLHDEFDLFKDA